MVDNIRQNEIKISITFPIQLLTKDAKTLDQKNLNFESSLALFIYTYTFEDPR